MRILILGCLFLSGGLSYSQSPTREDFAKNAGPAEGVPVEAFELANEDLKIEVWAESPMIFSPVAIDIDARGRVWATEGIDYQQKQRVANGRSIIVLEDKDQDGKADSSHVFVTEQMRHAPLGIAVFDNRIVLSATPSIIVYTDVDRNAVFDPAIDKREEFLTGFQNDRHDHTLHAVVGAPSGQWHFSFGNCGADIKTKDGRHFISGCYYGYPEGIGKPSSDGHVYVGGVTMRINPDGTGLEATAHNMRNSHDMAVSAFGDMFQSDNDDPAHCRSSWVMEYGNMGYADLRDGSRSWEEVAKSWEEPKGFSKNLRFSTSHWRENYPGACPPGSIYGAGSPTGNALIEDDSLGLAGTYLNACMVRKEIMATRPQLSGAGIDLGEHTPFIRLKESEKGQHFLPTDVALGLDGSLLLSDFYNDTSRRTNQVSGTIYRISRKGGMPKPDAIDFESASGLVAALKNPAVNVRSHAAWLIVNGAEYSESELDKLLQSKDPVLQARAIWVLAQLGNSGEKAVAGFLNHKDPQLVIATYRALRLGHPSGHLSRSRELAKSASAAVRREVAVSIRDVPFDECKDILKNLIAGYDGESRYYLEALGVAFTKKERAVYDQLIRSEFGDPKSWPKATVNLAWRLHTPEAIADLEAYMRHAKPGIDEFRHVAMAFASFREKGDRADRRQRLEAMGKLDWAASEPYQTTISEIIAKDLNELKDEFVDFSSVIPTDFGPKTEVSEPAVIAALEGDAKAGALQAGRCYMCHKIAGQGVAFGPDLTYWGAERTIEQIVKEIVDPDHHLAHGYDKPVKLTKGDHVVE
ncbi:MAG: PVC-type heme-binding CxxCH protein, partial [Verrucomicrobiota bacterium]